MSEKFRMVINESDAVAWLESDGTLGDAIVCMRTPGVSMPGAEFERKWRDFRKPILPVTDDKVEA
jgi:hypothetical protein